LDVSLLDLKKRLKSRKAASPLFDFIFKKIRWQRKKVRKALVRAVKKHRLVKCLKNTSSLYPKKEPSSEIFLNAILEQTQSSGEDLLNAWRRFAKKGRLTDLHRVRIDLKKWRYLLEIQFEYTGSPNSDHLMRIKSIQELLGNIHDTEVLYDFLNHTKIPKELRGKKDSQELNCMKNELKSQLESGLSSFHREGEKILLNLFSERSHS
jgi:CHAD domain-containing protein